MRGEGTAGVWEGLGCYLEAAAGKGLGGGGFGTGIEMKKTRRNCWGQKNLKSASIVFTMT